MERRTKKRTKKDMYNESLYDLRTYVNGDIAIKPYYYYRNGLLHVRYTVDRCVELSADERARLKTDLTCNPSHKQDVLSKAWDFFTNMVGKPVIMDGIAEVERRLKGKNKDDGDGYKN